VGGIVGTLTGASVWPMSLAVAITGGGALTFWITTRRARLNK
jgi:hypothetical protein